MEQGKGEERLTATPCVITQLKTETIWRAEGRQPEAGVRRGFVGLKNSPRG